MKIKSYVVAEADNGHLPTDNLSKDDTLEEARDSARSLIGVDSPLSIFLETYDDELELCSYEFIEEIKRQERGIPV